VTVAALGFTIVPGLSQTITVPSNSVLYVSTDGGFQTQTAATTGWSRVDIAIFIDGAVATNGGNRRIYAANTQGVTGITQTWSMAQSMTLAAGSHTIDVRTQLVDGTAPALVSGNSASPLRGEMTIVVVKQ
jgi:hypothetical protein